MRRGRPPYLNREFFDEIARTMPENLADRPRAPSAGADRNRDLLPRRTTLYGRYWGSLADFHSLHFETCYYQGIEYCIRERLRDVRARHAGRAQDQPRLHAACATWSCHWLRDRGFHAAIADFLRRETRHVDAYMDELDEHVPYRRNGDGAPLPALDAQRTPRRR